jgi:phosphoribosylformylglycinamidine (FGAM) synthase-like enzyme
MKRRSATSSAILIRDGLATAVHDLSDGGLAVALAEMAMASGIGATINQLEGGDPIPLFFGEDQGRYVVTVADAAIPTKCGPGRGGAASSRPGSAPRAARR